MTEQVSILSRPEERLQLAEVSRTLLKRRFQSSAAPKSGCNGVQNITRLEAVL